ncbi:MAG: hypothetical protein JXB15_08170 [Anaerolineales bacterium]|nr:hypothetical protein [Anaerolineales bacterium]
MSETPPPLYCANHPKVETTLRCNYCEKPICPRCAVLTPTGYRCKECVRGHQKVFENAQWMDNVLAFVVAAVLSFLGSLLASLFGFLTIFIAPIAGGIIAEAVRFVTRRRRSRNLFLVTAIGVALGSLPMLLIPIAGALMGSYGLSSVLFSLIWRGAYTILATSTAYYRLGGIQIK